ncbi:Gfo/Idh/MocA family protein [Paenibacillus kandeliae]|uniref:Gfo/Idh/MocA family protein n=1 Tax=Paenibacillus kandeliae TaxID=3231269 RepID=UPI00345A54F6
MIKVGLIGFGVMGHMHLENYIRLQAEGVQVQLVAICDVQMEQLQHAHVKGNIDTDTDTTQIDLSVYQLYTDMEQMLTEQQLDVIDICLPTDLHAVLAVDILQRGYHVFIEKPMALTVAEAQTMTEAARHHNRHLMVGQCLRFWPAYEYLKETVDSGVFGQPLGAYLFRGGDLPSPWFLDGKRSKGAMLDMHIHDVDIVQYIFGMPDYVSSIARNVIPGSAYDMCSSNYVYADRKVINTQVDWTLRGDYGFSMVYRVNFEHGNLVYEQGKVHVHPNDDQGYIAELSPDMGYYRQLRYFIEHLLSGEPMDRATPESTLLSMELVEAEMTSADRAGERVALSKVTV